jgi:hypothetical protein
VAVGEERRETQQQLQVWKLGEERPEVQVVEGLVKQQITQGVLRRLRDKDSRVDLEQKPNKAQEAVAHLNRAIPPVA